MHPTLFQLRAFGRCRMPSAEARSVLRHLRSGCGRCRVTLLPYLIPWLDEDAAAEARATAPAGAGPALRAAYLLAAERAARAAARDGAKTPGEDDVRKALQILRAEGPAALGRLPRPLLGRPAVLALLRLNRELGVTDPALRLCLGELACDLASMLPGGRAEGRPHRELRFRAALDLATTFRMRGDHRAAQHQLNQAAEDVLRGPHDPLAEANLIEVQSALLGNQWRLRTAMAGLTSVMATYRQAARREELVRALIFYGNCANYLYEFDVALEHYDEAVCLIDCDREPVLAAAALGNICNTLLRCGRWREGLRLFGQNRPVFERNPSALNAARFARMEGRFLKLAEDTAGASRIFAASHRAFTRLGKRYVAGLTLLDHAALLQRQGEVAGASALVLEATEMLLKLEPHREVYVALMLLRATSQFSATRPTLPLERVINFLDAAEFNPSLRLESYLSDRR